MNLPSTCLFSGALLFVNLQKEQTMLAVRAWKYPGLRWALDQWIEYVEERNYFHRQVSRVLLHAAAVFKR